MTSSPSQQSTSLWYAHKVSRYVFLKPQAEFSSVPIQRAGLWITRTNVNIQLMKHQPKRLEQNIHRIVGIINWVNYVNLASESLNGGQFTLSTQLIKRIYFLIFPTDVAVSLEAYPFIKKKSLSNHYVTMLAPDYHSSVFKRIVIDLRPFLNELLSCLILAKREYERELNHLFQDPQKPKVQTDIFPFVSRHSSTVKSFLRGSSVVNR